MAYLCNRVLDLGSLCTAATINPSRKSLGGGAGCCAGLPRRDVPFIRTLSRGGNEAEPIGRPLDLSIGSCRNMFDFELLDHLADQFADLQKAFVQNFADKCWTRDAIRVLRRTLYCVGKFSCVLFGTRAVEYSEAPTSISRNVQ